MDEIDRKEWYEAVSLADAKSIIKSNLITAARSFIAIGYYLKHIRDLELYIEDGYETIWDLAKAEFGISKSTASRYMTMNDRFSQNGNSPLIKDQYKEFGKSQLQEMLSLTDEQIEAVTPDISVQKLREMHRPKEIPYFEIEGQMDLVEDFPEAVPDLPQENQIPLKQSFTMDIGELLSEDEGLGAIAISQQNEEYAAKAQQKELSPVERGCITGLSPYGNCVCCGTDGMKCCGQCDEDCNGRCGWIERPVKVIENEEHKLLEEEKLPDESWNIGELPQAKEGLLRQLARTLVDRKRDSLLTVRSELGSPSDETIQEQVKNLTWEEDGEIILDNDVKACATIELVEFYRGEEDLGVCSYARLATQVRKALDEWFKTQSKGECAEQPEKSQPEPEKDQPNNVIDAEFTEIKPEPAIYDKDIMKEMIHQEEQMLSEMGENWKKRMPYYYTKHTMMLEAYRMLQMAQEGKLE